MDLIYLAYAHSLEEPLKSLQREDEEVNNILKERAFVDNHFNINRVSFATTKAIIEDLNKYKDKICIFHYSGHAASDSLLIEDKEANANAISKLLLECPNLKLVVLNGCSTKGQVEALLNEHEEGGVPAVIATSRPVNDEAATDFAGYFYRELVDRSATIEQAFTTAMNSLEVQDERKYDTPTNRSIIKRIEDTNAPMWGIYCRNDEKNHLDWVLPGNYERPEPIVNFNLNQHLFKNIFLSLASHRPEIKRLLNRERDLNTHLESIKEKDRMVLRSLPHTISEQLRILRAKSDNDTSEEFCDQFGKSRLNQLFKTYDATIQLLVFILLAQFWDLLNLKETDITIEEEEIPAFLSIFHLSPNVEVSRYESLIRLLMDKLIQTTLPLFITEVKLSEHHFHLNDSVFFKTCHNIESIDRTKIQDHQVTNLCVTVERELALLFPPILFISNYRLASVKSINVKKQRHLPHPNFLHTVIELEHDILRFDQTIESSNFLMDDTSVVLCKCKLDSNGVKISDPYQSKASSETPQYLNLSPFLTDRNASDQKSPTPFILYFHSVEKESKELQFLPIYETNHPPIKLSKENGYENIYKQFDIFSQLIFKKPLVDTL